VSAEGFYPIPTLDRLNSDCRNSKHSLTFTSPSAEHSSKKCKLDKSAIVPVIALNFILILAEIAFAAVIAQFVIPATKPSLC
jgi:hypothetical protein